MYKIKKSDALIIAQNKLAFEISEKGKREEELGIAIIELAFQDEEKGKRALELIIANKELAFQNEEKEKRAAELIIANKELAFLNGEKQKRASELIIATKKSNELEELLRNNLKEISDYKYVLDESSIITITDQYGIIKKVNNNFCLITKYSEEELIGQDHRIINSGYHPKEVIRNLWLTITSGKIWRGEIKNKAKDGTFYWVDTVIVPFLNEKGYPYQYLASRADITARKETEEYLIQRTAQLETANKKLVFQHEEKEKRAEELILANNELAYQNQVKEKRAAELVMANEELAFQNHEKEKRAAELNIANIELAYQNDEKEKRAEELIIANKELAYQNDEKEKRAAELNIANKELAYQNDEKEKRAAELSIANKELAYQNKEKEKRAEELVMANKELAYQNQVKEKRAAQLIIANKELAYQNDEKEKRAKEKEKRAAELNIANIELAFQNEEKEKRAVELSIANKELQAFSYVSSHDLQEPLRKIQIFTTIILENENENLTENGKYNFKRIQSAVGTMRQLIDDLLSFSRINAAERKFEKTDLDVIIAEIKAELKENIEEKHATIQATELGLCNIIVFQFRQLMYNLISNALKFTKPDVPPHIIIKSSIIKGDKLRNACLNYKVGQKNFLPEKNYYHISIRDNGIGFEPHYSERIFELFQRLHRKEEYAGTGIGLSIVKKIVENHNGIIRATGQLNKGATFDIYIPINEE